MTWGCGLFRLPSMDIIKGCTAVVTGGASGIGRAISLALSRESVRVVVADLDETGMAGTVNAIKEAGGNAIAVRTDVSSLPEVQALTERARDSFGPISILCNNAGVSIVGGLERATYRDWQWVMGVNLWGVIHGIMAFVPCMIEEGKGGHIINTASMAGLVATQWLGVYTATKYAVVGLSETLRKDLKPYNIGVSVLCPMSVDTRITESERNRPEQLKDPGIEHIQVSVDFLGRVITAEEVAVQVISAIKKNQLYIITHEEALDQIRRRFQRMEREIQGKK